MDVSPQGIRAVQFREKLRGYHPEDVDAFVAAVAQKVEDLETWVKQAEARLAELQTRQEGATEAEESLRRTLILAQRTADAAIQEAREEAARVSAEAAAQRQAAEADAQALRDRLQQEAEQEGRSERERLSAERAALLADVEALSIHVERERERLRIYFSDQLRRVEQGEPATAPPPAMQAAEVAPAPAPHDQDGVDGSDPDAPPSVDPAGDRGVDATDADGRDAADGDGRDPAGVEDEATANEASGGDDDPFLAELRRAVSDDRPLGPREDEPSDEASDTDDDGFDLFAKGGDDPGRFGSRRRRNR